MGDDLVKEFEISSCRYHQKRYTQKNAYSCSPQLIESIEREIARYCPSISTGYSVLANFKRLHEASPEHD